MNRYEIRRVSFVAKSGGTADFTLPLIADCAGDHPRRQAPPGNTPPFRQVRLT